MDSKTLMEQISEALLCLKEGHCDKVLANKLKIDNLSAEEKQAGESAANSLKSYADDFCKNRELVQELLPSVFQLVSNMSVTDVSITLSNTELNRLMVALNNIIALFRDEFSEISESQRKNYESVLHAFDLLKESADEVTSLDSSMKDEQQMIMTIQKTLSDLTSRSDEMSVEVDALIELTKKIASTISGIKAVADHTTLLALNASVEAARAGEAGKGFSVIATEVRTLSNDTKNLLDTLNTLLGEVNTASGNSKKGVRLTSDGIRKMDEMTKALHENTLINTKSASDVSEKINNTSSFMQIVADGTQQTTDTITLSVEKIDEISEIAEDVSKVANNLEANAKSITSLMDTSGASMTKLAGKILMTKQLGMSNKDFIDIIEKAIIAHKNWVKTAGSMVESMRVSALQTNEHKCGFGYYYYALSPKAPEVSKIWNEIESIHHNLHKKGEFIIECVRANDSDTAKSHLRDAETYSDAICRHFNDILIAVKGLGDRSVFTG